MFFFKQKILQLYTNKHINNSKKKQKKQRRIIELYDLSKRGLPDFFPCRLSATRTETAEKENR